jgi:hypothetical protein
MSKSGVPPEDQWNVSEKYKYKCWVPAWFREDILTFASTVETIVCRENG